MDPSRDSLGELARENKDFRRVVATGPFAQVVLMSLRPGEAIGAETHDDTDQVFVVAKGSGEAVVGGVRQALEKGSLMLVPAGTRHDIRNTGEKRLRLVTIYAPPHHPPGTVHATRDEAMQAEAHAHV